MWCVCWCGCEKCLTCLFTLGKLKAMKSGGVIMGYSGVLVSGDPWFVCCFRPMSIFPYKYFSMFLKSWNWMTNEQSLDSFIYSNYTPHLVQINIAKRNVSKHLKCQSTWQLFSCHNLDVLNFIIQLNHTEAQCVCKQMCNNQPNMFNYSQLRLDTNHPPHSCTMHWLVKS